MKSVLLLSLLLFPVPVRSSDKKEPEVFFCVTRAASRRALPPADALSLDLAPRAPRADSVADALAGAAPLFLRRQNGALGLATVSMRGFQARQTSVYLDDVRLPADITGTVDLSVLPAAALGRAEALPGSSASLYGANAAGGVLQLFSRRLSPGARLAEASSEFSSYDTSAHTLRAGAAGRTGDIFAAGSAVSSDGFQRNGAAEKGSASAKGELRLGRFGRLGATALASRLRTGLPSGTPAPVAGWNGSREREPNSTTDWQLSRRGFGALSWSAGGPELGATAGASVSSNYIKAFQYGSLTAARVTDRALTARFALGPALLGAERAVSSLDSAAYGDHDLHSAGFFAQGLLEPAEGLELTPALRYDRANSYAGRLSPKLSAVYSPDGEWTFSASAGLGYQPPTFADLYNPWAAPAPGLKPETSVNSSAAARYGSPGGWFAGLSYYYSDIRNRIALDPATFAAANLDAGFNSGFEAQAGWRGEALSLEAGWTRGRSQVRGASGGHVPMSFSPRDRWTGRLGADLGFARLSLEGRGAAEQYSGRGRTGKRLPEYWAFGARLSRAFGPAEAWAGAENLLDRHYAETADSVNGWYPQPGRTFSAGLTVRFL